MGFLEQTLTRTGARQLQSQTLGVERWLEKAIMSPVLLSLSSVTAQSASNDLNECHVFSLS